MDESASPRERHAHHRNTVPAAAVVAVAVAAFAAAWFTLKPEPAGHAGRPERPLDVPVVRAPPVETQSGTSVLGSGPACKNCGTVEAVVAQDNNTHFQLRVRMDDGTVKTLEQATPASAGARVTVQGGIARPRPASGAQG